MPNKYFDKSARLTHIVADIHTYLYIEWAKFGYPFIYIGPRQAVKHIQTAILNPTHKHIQANKQEHHNLAKAEDNPHNKPSTAGEHLIPLATHAYAHTLKRTLTHAYINVFAVIYDNSK